MFFLNLNSLVFNIMLECLILSFDLSNLFDFPKEKFCLPSWVFFLNHNIHKISLGTEILYDFL